MARHLPALALIAVVYLLPSAGLGQSPDRVPIVGLLTVTAGPSDPVATKFRDGLAQLGYIDGQNIKIDHRNAQGHPENLPRLADELVRMPVDVIAVGAEPALSAVARATTTIPIVVVSVDDDLVATGLVKSLSHPGGNITGLSALQSEVARKRLELLRDAIPGLTRVCVFWDPLNRRGASEIDSAARSMGLAMQPIKVPEPYDFDAAFRTVKKTKAGAVLVLFSPGFYIQRERLAKAALSARVPVMYPNSSEVEAGGLMSYGPESLWGRAAYYVDRVLKGTKPSELPIEQVSQFRLVVNARTASALGITFPESIWVRVDEVIK
jgi:putative ABC transport system substrate-binding protein